MSSWLNVSIVVHSIDPPRFGLRHLYSQALISIYKSIPESAFEPTSKVWHFPFHAKSDILEKVRALPGVDVEELPSFVQSLVNVVREEVTGVGGVSGPKDVEEEIQYRMGSVPEKLMSSLYPFQVESLVFAVKRRGKILLGDEMGLGKTLQALAVACAYREDWPILVVAPSSLRANWRDEATKWVPGLTKENIQIVKDAKAGVRDGALMVVVSYDLATRMADKSLLWKGQFQVVIADESHYLKSVDAQRTRAIVPLIQSSARSLCLSGTPALSRPAELFMQLNALMPRAFGSFLPFAQRYCAAHQASWGLDTRGSSNTSELKMIMEEAVMIRRLKDQVLSELLPGKDRQIVDVPCDPKIMKEIADVKKEKKNIEKDLKAVTEEWQKARLNGELRAATSQLYSASGLAKVKGVLEHLKKLLDEDGGFFDKGMPTLAKGNAPSSDGASSGGDASEALSGHEGLQGGGRLEESSSIEDRSRDEEWACSRCTFLNPATTLKCQMCASSKPGEERSREGVECEGRSERARLGKRMTRKLGKEESEGVPAMELGLSKGLNKRKDDVELCESGRRTLSQLTSCSGKETLSDGEDGDEWMKNSDDGSNNNVMRHRLAGGGRRLTKLGGRGGRDGNDTFCGGDSCDEELFDNDNTPRQIEKIYMEESGSGQDEMDLKGDLVTCKGERGGISDRASSSSEDVDSIKPMETSEVAIGSKESKAGVKSSSNNRNESPLSDEDDDVVCVHPPSRGNGISGKDPVHRAAAATAAAARSRTKKGKKGRIDRECSRGQYGGFNTDKSVENGEVDRADEDGDDDIFHSDLMFAKGKKKQRQLRSSKQEPGSIVGKSNRKRLKLVVFAHHKAVMNLLESGLNDIGVRSVRIDGTTSQAERQPIVNRFQQDESLSVILLAITAAGVGITLTAASCAIFAELYWTPGSMAQAEDRIHRIGQKAKTVLIQYMVGRGTVDDVMIPLIHRKQWTLKSTVGLNQDTGDYSKVSGTKRQSSGSTPKAKHQQITSKPRGNVSTADPSQRKLEFAPSLAKKPNPAVGTVTSTALDIKGDTSIPTSGAASPAALTEARVVARSASKPLSQGTLSDFVDVSQPEDLPRYRPGFPTTTTSTVRGGYTPPRQFRNLNGGPVVTKSSSEHIVTHPPSSRSSLDFALKESPRGRPPAGPTVRREKGTKQAVVLTAEQQERIARNKRAALQKLAERKRERQMQQAQPGWLCQEQGKTNSSYPQSPSSVVLTPPVTDSPSARIAPRSVAPPAVRADTPPGRVGGGVEGVGSGERPRWCIGVTGSRSDESSCIKGESGRNSSGESRRTAAVETGRLKRTSD